MKRTYAKQFILMLAIIVTAAFALFILNGSPTPSDETELVRKIEADSLLNNMTLTERILAYDKRVREDGLTIFYESDNLIYLSVDGESYPNVVQSLEPMYLRVSAQYDLLSKSDDDELIDVLVYPTQAAFWKDIFAGETNNLYSVGFFDPDNFTIFVVSPDDTSIFNEEQMIHAMQHELVHVLLFSSDMEILEGSAIYISDQLEPYTIDNIPQPIDDPMLNKIRTHGGTQMNYYAGWKVKFMIEECLDGNRPAFAELVKGTDEIDYSQLGFESKDEFDAAYHEYLIENALPN